MTREADRRVAKVLAWLRRRGSRKNREGMARYGIVAPKVFGVSVGDLRGYAKPLGHDHALALALWKTGWYEVRMLAAFVDEPDHVTVAQMDRWASDFDNWAVCDHACFHLFDKTAHGWNRINVWQRSRDEFVRRAAFALIASIGMHDKAAADAQFRRCFPMIRRAATDDRNFVKKGVSWALRVIGNRNPALHVEAMALADELAASSSRSARWIGSDARRDLTSVATAKRLARSSTR